MSEIDGTGCLIVRLKNDVLLRFPDGVRLENWWAKVTTYEGVEWQVRAWAKRGNMRSIGVVGYGATLFEAWERLCLATYKVFDNNNPADNEVYRQTPPHVKILEVITRQCERGKRTGLYDVLLKTEWHGIPRGFYGSGVTKVAAYNAAVKESETTTYD